MDESVTAVVASGDRRRSLEALRDRLARELDEAFGKDVALIVKQLAEVIREIDSLPGGKEASTVDELARKRADRLAAAAGQ